MARTADNPYVKAFWDWWPQLYPRLRTFRLTGGEPLLSNDVWRCLESVAQNPRPQLQLAVNTNLQAPEKLMNRLVEVAGRLAGKVGLFEIYTSCEAKGAAAEYTRFGLNYELFMGNVRRLLVQAPSVRVNFMVTFNALSVTTFLDFLDDILDLRLRYNESGATNRLPLVISYLRWPPFLAVHVLPEEIRFHYADLYDRFADTFADEEKLGFEVRRLYLEEVDQLRRLAAWLRSPAPPEEELRKNRADFKSFIETYDKRRGTDFAAVFPELAPFLEQLEPYRAPPPAPPRGWRDFFSWGRQPQ